ncbi:MAG: glycoside hydrolase, partial [Actinobacteria bacterium]|nr:glycoside hydrolase [Actinomycetota bacterium]
MASPAAAAQRGQAAQLSPSPKSPLRVGTNYPLTFPAGIPIYGRDAVSLAVNPRNHRHIVAMYSDYKTLWCEVVVSTDGGRKWRRTRLKAPPGFISPPCTVGNHLANFVDEGIAFGKDNNVYATFASGILDEQGDSQGKSVLVARSDNGGRSFSTGVVALAGGDDPDRGPDYTLPKLVVKPGSGNADDRIYVVANSEESDPKINPQLRNPPTQNFVMVTTSSDGGRTWGPRVSANPNGQNAVEATQPVLGKNDTLYVAWRTRRPATTGPGRFAAEGAVVVGRSTDHGLTWKHSTAAGVQGFIYTGPVTPPYSRTPTIFNASTFPRLAADPKSGNVYLTYGNGGPPQAQGTVGAADHFIHKNMNVWFQRSTNGGETWSEPDRLNGQAPIQFELTQTRHPNVSVARNGRVDIVWQDRRHWYRGCVHTHSACTEARLGDTYYAYSTNRGRTFTSDHRISDRSTNNDVGYDYRFGTYWAYAPVAVPVGRHRLLVAWMDSRLGNFDTDAQDIFMARVNVRPRGRIRAVR